MVMAAVRAERRVLAELEGGCMIPLAAWGREDSGRLTLTAAVFGPDGRDVCRAEATGSLDDPDVLGRQVAEVLRRGGAERLLGRE
jgi:hydroxymethylbilane synthase